MLIYVVCDEDGLWHGQPDADLDSPPTTGRLQVPPGCGPFAGQMLLIRFAPMEATPGPCGYPVEGQRRAVYATYDVYQLLGDWDEEITDSHTQARLSGHGASPAQPSAQATHHLQTAEGAFTITLGTRSGDGHDVEVEVLGCDQNGECSAQLAGILQVASLGALGRALQAMAENLPGAVPPPPRPAHRRGDPWSEQDHELLRERARAGAPVADIAHELGRTDLAVRWKMWTFGLGPRPDPAARAPQPAKPEPAYTFEDLRQVHPNSHQRWTTEEEQRLIARAGQGASISDLVTEFGRNEGGITSRLARLEELEHPGG